MQMQMYEELHVLSPVVPTREFHFLRYCRQIDQGLWAIADVSLDLNRENQFNSPLRSRRLPSGCLIQDMPNGYSKVIHYKFVHDTLVLRYVYVLLFLRFLSATFWCRLLGWNTWKLKRKLALIYSIGNSSTVGRHSELNDG